MMKWTILLATLVGLALAGPTQDVAQFDQQRDWKSALFYDFWANDIDGNVVSLSEYKGKVLIVVNVASNCDLTESNYKQLQALYQKYKEQGLRILAFPCNQFKGQEPGSSQEIKDFVKKYNVSFDMFEKIEVNGENTHPLWKWMKAQPNPAKSFSQDISWNFTKFVINRQGEVVARFTPHTEPKEMAETLEIYLQKEAEL
ncbi:probable glutathione peroxidase 2 [Belonocnema kinseyi]|uniref:probable glutathione peroxidase 2 n=1 Tax=Belonocnema kinseyi TaxID=2817044 RepID=UPI00143DB604|nr:probable glutathione peroxidase 2 [Belonocnema kinseyi]